MKALKHICFYLSVILCIVCFLYPMRGKAEGHVSLTVEMAESGVAVPNAEFRIYRIGSHLDADGQITLTEPYASHFTIDVAASENWDELAAQIMAWVDTEQLPCTDTCVTDAHGKAKFPTSGELTEGLYLVSATTVTYRNKIYTTLPFLVLLPAWNTETAAWVSDVVAQPKIGVTEPTPEPTAEPTPTPTPTPHEEPSATPTSLPRTGVEWRPTFWLSGFGVIFLILSIVTGCIAFRKEEKQ